MFAAPVIWLTGNPVLAHNLAELGSYVLAGGGMYLLARSLWGRPDAAVLAALAFAFAPHRVLQASHLQVLMSGWMPISLWGLHRYFWSGSLRALAVFAGAFALLGLSNGYFLYYFSIPAGLVAVCELARTGAAGAAAQRFRMPWRRIAELAGAAAAILAAIAPAACAYLRVRQTLGLRRTLDEMASFGAAWPDYLRIPDGLWVWSGILKVGIGERMLFPGLTIVVLTALAGLTLRRSAWPGAVPKPARWGWHVGIYAGILGLALWLCAGPEVAGPYRVLLHVLPGFDGLRVPARFIVVVALALSVLGSAGAAWLFGRLRPRAAVAAAVVLGAAITLEGYGGRMHMVPFRHDQQTRARLNAWLRTEPPGGVLELPIIGPAFEPLTLVHQYNTLLHGHPIVNGYSGYGYALQDFLGGWASPLKEPEALPDVMDGLRAIGVRYVVLHRSAFAGRPELGWPDPDRLVDAIDRATGQLGPRFDDAVAWTLGPPRPRVPVAESSLSAMRIADWTLTASAKPDLLRFAFDGDLYTSWSSGAPQAGREWIRLAFSGAPDIGRLVFLTYVHGVGGYPRGLEVEGETPDGSRITLYSGSFLPPLLEGLSTGTAGSPAVLDLPSNRVRALWIRQTGRSAAWQWSVHELQVYERRGPG
jgi:hypothetical protein